jgi:hypothetical protein
VAIGAACAGDFTAPTNGLLVEGSVGIGSLLDANTKLEVDGIVRLKDTESPDPLNQYAVAGTSYLRSDEGALCAGDEEGNETQLSTHMDPRTFVPEAVTSFADPSVEYPFSFHHRNVLLGKGQVVDMAKLVKVVNQISQNMYGPQAGQLIFTYDLPESQKVTAEQYAAAQLDNLVNLDLAANPWVEVALGPDGAIPAEALDQVEIMEPVVTGTRIVAKPSLDLANGRVIMVEEEEEVKEMASTGQFKTQFKAGYDYRAGKVYRKRTADDVDKAALAAKIKDLPQWILDRVPGEAQ